MSFTIGGFFKTPFALHHRLLLNSLPWTADVHRSAHGWNLSLSSFYPRQSLVEQIRFNKQSVLKTKLTDLYFISWPLVCREDLVSSAAIFWIRLASIWLRNPTITPIKDPKTAFKAPTPPVTLVNTELNFKNYHRILQHGFCIIFFIVTFTVFNIWENAWAYWAAYIPECNFFTLTLIDLYSECILFWKYQGIKAVISLFQLSAVQEAHISKSSLQECSETSHL